MENRDNDPIHVTVSSDLKRRVQEIAEGRGLSFQVVVREIVEVGFHELYGSFAGKGSPADTSYVCSGDFDAEE